MKITLINELKAKNSNKNSVNSSIFETLFKNTGNEDPTSDQGDDS